MCKGGRDFDKITGKEWLGHSERTKLVDWKDEQESLGEKSLYQEKKLLWKKKGRGMTEQEIN